MSCPIHDYCTCYGASLPFTAPLTAPGSSHLASQMNNIFVGYEWAAPMVTTSAAWYSLESAIIQPPTSHSGQEILQSDRYRHGDTHGALPHHNVYQREFRAHEREQRPGPCEQFAPYPSPFIQGVSRMAMPSNYSEPSMPLAQACRNSAPGFANYDGFSEIESVMNLDLSTPIDEPPPPYPTNSMLVSPLSDIFPQSTLSRPERLSNVGPITPSPLAPVPQRHNSLYQVLKHESQASHARGTVSSAVSSIAHALELPEQPARLVPPPCTPALGNGRGPTIGASETSLSASQIASTSLAAVAAANACLAVPKLPTLPAVQVRVQSPVSRTTPPSAVTMQAQNGSAVVTPSRGHTLVQSLPEATTNDYDTLPRLRKRSRRLVLPQPASPGPSTAKEEHSAASSPLSPLPSRPPSSTGAPAAAASSRKGHSPLESAFSQPLSGRKRPVLRAKLACLFCRRRKIQCRPLPGDNLGNTCRQCAKRSRRCEYPEMTWRGRGRKRSQSEAEESDDEEEDPPSQRAKSRRAPKLRSA